MLSKMQKLKTLSKEILEEYFAIVKDYCKRRFTFGKSSLTYINKRIKELSRKNNSDKIKYCKKKKMIEEYKKLISDKRKLDKLKELILLFDVREILRTKPNLFENLKVIYEQFDWDQFRNNKTRKNIFKKIIDELGVKVCPYCGRHYVDCIDGEDCNVKKNSKKKTKRIIVPCLDHFVAKGAKKSKVIKDNSKKKNVDAEKYIQYSLSIYNLIPSCYLCNSQFKHDKDVSGSDYEILYPFKEGFEDNVKFNFNFGTLEKQQKYINALTGNCHAIDDVEICLVNTNKVNDKSYLKRCRNSNTMFKIEYIYNEYHHDNAVDLVNKIVWFRKNYAKSWANILKLQREYNNALPIATNDSICPNENQIYNLKNILGVDFNYLFGHWMDKENDLKEPLSKFYRDIYEQVIEPHIYKPLMNDMVIERS